MDDLITKYNKRCEDAEKNVARLEVQLQALSSNDVDAALIEGGIADKDYIALLTENRKLKYRIGILKKSIAGQTMESSSSEDLCTNFSDHMCNIQGHLEALFLEAAHLTYPEVKDPWAQIQVSRHADYQCNMSMAIAKSIKKNPKQVGQALLDTVAQKLCSPVIDRMELSGPGFINIYLSQEFIKQQVTNLLIQGVTPPLTKRLKVIVDFSSPNIAKEMHVGHLRSTIIGDSIARLLEFLGHDVLRLNHLGDWGTQFGMLIAHLQDKCPNYATNTPDITNLQAFYKESKTRFDEDPDFKKRAMDCVVSLQAHEPLHKKCWLDICDISKREFEKVYERLGVVLTPRGESFYQSRMEKLVKELQDGGFLEEDEGRKVMFADGLTVPLTVIKSDGAFTYDTSDMACLKQRLHEEMADWIVYVTDAGQAMHFKNFFACAQRAGFYDPSKHRLDHVTFGVVLGEDKKKFKTRSGDTVRLADLLDEGIQRAQEKLIEGERDKVLTSEEFKTAKEAVAYGCIKYADLRHDRVRDYIFSFDRMLDVRGNTAAYLLYCVTRIRSIARNAGVSPESLVDSARGTGIPLEHEKEWKLARTLLKLPDVLVKVTLDLYLHPLCEFMYEVSTVFSEFYDVCYCIEKDSDGTVKKIHTGRLMLCEATARVMEKCFFILGIQPVGKM